MTEWLVVGLDVGVHWPTVETGLRFEGHEILLRPETDRLAPSVVMGYEPPMGQQEALHLVRRFLSSVAWVKGGHLREIMVMGGSHPIGVGKGPMARLIDTKFRVDYLPEPADPKARLALALYREAMGLNSEPYQFLGFYKVVNMLYETGPDQKAWINSTVDKVENHIAQQRLAELRAQGEDVGNYLYESGRCAVAHAFNEPVVNPDDPKDTQRLANDLRLMKGLAEYAVEHELGVQSIRTVWHEHVYELQGFRELLSGPVIAALKSKQDFSLEAIPSLPPLSVRLRDHAPFGSLEGVHAEPVATAGGRLVLRCVSDDDLLQALLGLNFAEEHLEFDPINDVAIYDDGSVQAVQKALDRVRLVQGLYSNGQLEVWDSERQILLGRCDPFIPVDVDLKATDENLERIAAALSGEIKRRQGSMGQS
jgi:hypothetical protein